MYALSCCMCALALPRPTKHIHLSTAIVRKSRPNPDGTPASISQVKTITSLTLAALAEAASPYGIESFDDVLEPLWRGIRSLRGKVCAHVVGVALCRCRISVWQCAGT